MIDFEKEIKKFKKIPETSNIEEEIYGDDITDFMTLISKIINDYK